MAGVKTRGVIAAVVSAAMLVLGGCTGEPSEQVTEPAAGGFRAGAAGIGDPYYPALGNGGYDVVNYDLRIRYDPRTDRLSGQAVITARATQNLSRFNLDFSGLEVESVRVDGAHATHRRDGDELVVTPATGLPDGSRFTVDVRYAGVPEPASLAGLGAEGFIHTSDGAIAIGEPRSASTWFPVNDHPSDKATYTIAITVPDGLAALSNGVPVGTTAAGGWTTWRWAERSLMASYLATIVIGEYRVNSTTHNGRPMVTAVAESLPEGTADRALARTGEIADFLAEKFGPYPFEAYGGVVHNERLVSFALENQARPVYSPGFFTDDARATGVVAHEIAHQWFGNSVSVARWQDIWLNEGFAQYAQWLWTEHSGGPSVDQQFARLYSSAGDRMWRVPPGDPGPDMFTSGGWAIYQRGSMAVHALRKTVGDDAFFRILRTWAEEKRDGNATIEEFVAHAERVSGRSLGALFDAWLFGTEKPPRP